MIFRINDKIRIEKKSGKKNLKKKKKSEKIFWKKKIWKILCPLLPATSPPPEIGALDHSATQLGTQIKHTFTVYKQMSQKKKSGRIGDFPLYTGSRSVIFLNWMNASQTEQISCLEMLKKCWKSVSLKQLNRFAKIQIKCHTAKWNTPELKYRTADWIDHSEFYWRLQIFSSTAEFCKFFKAKLLVFRRLHRTLLQN